MPHLVLESDKHGSLPLNGVATTGRGTEALAGVTGLGLPPVNVQWRAGAGDGALYRGKRVPRRDIDIPIYIGHGSREELKAAMRKFALIVSDQMWLRWVDGDESWRLRCVRTGGGGYSYGEDTTGEGDLMTVLTVTAGDPYWESGRTATKLITPSTGAGLLNGSLSKLGVSGSQALGSITLDNTGDADAYPVWTVTGPGDTFYAENERGESFTWNGTLGAGEKLIVDTQAGTVEDENGNNKYADMGTAPQLWKLPPGVTSATAQLSNAVAGTSIECKFRPRKYAVI